MKQDVFGSKGHFTTSPEISQIFGELIGAWLLNEWNRFGEPKPLNFVEIGPGRGKEMQTFLTHCSSFTSSHLSIFHFHPSHSSPLSISLIRFSPSLSSINRHTNRRHHPSVLAISEGPKLSVDLTGGDLAVLATGTGAEPVRYDFSIGAGGREQTKRTLQPH